MSAAIVPALLMSTSIGCTLLAQFNGPHPVDCNAASVHHSRGVYDTPELALVPDTPTLAAPNMVAGFTVLAVPTATAHFAAPRRAGRAPPTV
jgi:hypothetical protein